jgi:hypothetical protein
MRKMSRMEISKECRRVLNRHGVDLSYCQYICSPYEVRLHGELYKIDGSDFNANEIDYMIHDFRKVLFGINVFGELENWRFTSDQIQYTGDKSTKTGGSDKEAEVYYIDLDDYDFEAS